MLILTYTNRGAGIEHVYGSGSVSPSGDYMSILSPHELMIVLCEGDQEQGRVFVSVEEIRTIVEFLRNTGSSLALVSEV